MKQILDYADIFIAPFFLAYLWASDKFCKKFLGTSKGREWLFLTLSFCGCLSGNIMCRLYPVSYIFYVVLSPVFFMGLVMLLFRSDKEKRILAAAMLLMVVRTVAGFCDSFLSCMVLFFKHTVKRIPEPFLGEWEIGLVGGVGYCFAILAVCWMAKCLGSVFAGKRGRWYVILAIPLLIIVAVIDVVNWGAANGIMVKGEKNMGLYYDQIFSHAEICVLTGLSLFATGFYVFGMNRIYLEQEKSNRYHSQIAVYKMLAEQYSQSERLRHDMKNHIIALSGLFQSKEWEKMGGYLKQLEENGMETGGDMTGNKAVDALLYQKRKRAEKEKVRWECDIQIPKVCCINEFDLCVLFGNILDNALEACERLQMGECGFINIQARTVKKCFLIEVKNSVDRMEKFESKLSNHSINAVSQALLAICRGVNYAEGVSSKEDQQEHGIGLLNVGDVVHKYNGAVNIEAENGIFIISILIPLNDAAHNIKQTV